MAPIVLTTQQVTTVTALAVISLSFSFGPNDAGTIGRLVYGPSDSNGNLLPNPPGGYSVVQLTPADVTIFFSTPGTLRVRAQAALQSNLGAAAAGVSS